MPLFQAFSVEALHEFKNGLLCLVQVEVFVSVEEIASEFDIDSMRFAYVEEIL